MSKAGELAKRHIKNLTLDDLPSVSNLLVETAKELRNTLRNQLETGQQVIVRNGNHEIIGKIVSVSTVNAKVRLRRETKTVDILNLRPIDTPVPFAGHANSS